MNTDIVLAELDTARTALAKADTIQKTKKVLDVAVAAEIYAKRQKLGDEAIMYATSIKVEALRQLGNMLKDGAEKRERQIRGGDRKSKFSIGTLIPTLSEIGLDKKTSKLAQDIASLPDEQFERVRSGVVAITAAQKEAREKEIKNERDEIAKAGKKVKPSERYHIYQADIQTWKAPKQYDFIITDPPYPKEFLYLYEVLAQRANEWLVDGGLLIAMCGQSYLDEILSMMSKHIEYYWTGAYLTPGQPTPLRQINVNTTWKPLLMFSKGKYTGKIFGDVFVSDGNDKSMHKWGQSESGMYSIISKICLEGQSILDPFCGAGTTGVATLRFGCLFDGIDLEEEKREYIESEIT